MRKLRGVLILIGLLLIMPLVSHALDNFLNIGDTPTSSSDVPENVTLSSTKDTITVEWDGDSDADTYNIYWGTSSDNLDQNASVEDPTEEYTITGLSAGTQYFIAVSSVNNGVESDRSAVQSITTESEADAPPATPSGFDITVISDITETSAKFSWEENSESDLAEYIIYYGTSSGTYDNDITVDGGSTEKTVTGLTSASRYFFTISAVDSSDNESKKADELIVDTKPDTLAPFKPAGVKGTLGGSGEIRITIDSSNERMADFAGHNIYYGTTPGEYDYSIDIGKESSHVFSELPEEEKTWYFTASAYDDSANEGDKTGEVSVIVEDISLFLGDSHDTDSGCFIQSAGQSIEKANKWKIFGCMFIIGVCLSLIFIVRRVPAAFFLFIILILPCGHSTAGEWNALGNNTIGVTGGYYVAADSDYRDFYGEDTYPVMAFYDRFITDHFSIEIESGYFQDSGDLLTESGKDTDIESEIEMVPIALSLKFHFPIVSYVTGYIGVGGDYWYVNEEPDDSSVHDDVDEWVGGYHGKIGFKFYNRDETFRGTGALIETGYSSVDKFGDNDMDIGGWITKFGIFYQF